ncbi:hypothetical protein BVX98_04595, partial [bacterium F11]
MICVPRKRVLFWGLFYLGVCFSTCWGATQTDSKSVGEISAGFLQVPLSARIAALGANQAALKGSVDTFTSNPATLSYLDIPQLQLAHNQSLIDTRYNTVILGLPWKKSVWGM